jgi:hypothetical protein
MAEAILRQIRAHGQAAALALLSFNLGGCLLLLFWMLSGGAP